MSQHNVIFLYSQVSSQWCHTCVHSSALYSRTSLQLRCYFVAWLPVCLVQNSAELLRGAPTSARHIEVLRSCSGGLQSAGAGWNRHAVQQTCWKLAHRPAVLNQWGPPPWGGANSVLGGSRLKDGRGKKKIRKKKNPANSPPCQNSSGWTIITHKQIILPTTFFVKSDDRQILRLLLVLLETFVVFGDLKARITPQLLCSISRGCCREFLPVQKHSQAVILSVPRAAVQSAVRAERRHTPLLVQAANESLMRMAATVLA